MSVYLFDSMKPKEEVRKLKEVILLQAKKVEGTMYWSSKTQSMVDISKWKHPRHGVSNSL